MINPKGYTRAHVAILRRQYICPLHNESKGVSYIINIDYVKGLSDFPGIEKSWRMPRLRKIYMKNKN